MERAKKCMSLFVLLSLSVFSYMHIQRKQLVIKEKEQLKTTVSEKHNIPSLL